MGNLMGNLMATLKDPNNDGVIKEQWCKLAALATCLHELDDVV
jgi:hypothetical protein